MRACRVLVFMSAAAISMAPAIGSPPVIWNVRGIITETQWLFGEIIQQQQREERGSEFFWDQQIAWIQDPEFGTLRGFTQQQLVVAPIDGVASVFSAQQRLQWEYIHSEGWPFFAYGGRNELIIAAYVLGAPGTACRFEVTSTTTWPAEPDTPSVLDVVGWTSPGWAFDWGNAGATYVLNTSSTDEETIEFEGRQYSRVWIHPTSEVRDSYRNTGPWQGSFRIGGGLDHHLRITVTNLGLCRADFTRDGVVNSQDFFAFLAAFFAYDTASDFNMDGSVNSQDLFDYLGAFFVGC